MNSHIFKCSVCAQRMLPNVKRCQKFASSEVLCLYKEKAAKRQT